MNVIAISNRKFNELSEVKLENNILNTEAKMYNFVYKGEKKILKSLYNLNGQVFANKLYTLEMLDANREYLPSNFCIPDYLCVLAGRVIGFTLPKVEGINLSNILKENSVNYKEQIYYLKKVGELLQQLHNIRKYTPLTDIYINDLHDCNFIVNIKNKELKVVDLDSCKICNNKPFASRFLTSKSLLKECKKYQLNHDTESNAYIVADGNTDLYCYSILILNYLYGNNINNLNIEEYYEYLNYLDYVGIDKELLNSFKKIISEGPNISPAPFIDSLTSEQICRAKEFVYKKVKNLR